MSQRFFPCLFVIVVCIWCCATGNHVFARTLHVATTGNDSADGSPKAPLLTINNAARMARAGDTILVAPGVYENGIVDVFNHGQPDKYITIRSAEPRKAKLIGTFRTTGNYLRIQDFEIQNPGDEYGISTFTNHHIEITGNLVHHCGGGGIGSTRSDWLTIEYNECHHNATRNVRQHSGISVFQPRDLADGDATPIRIRFNILHHNRTERTREGRQPTDGNGIILDDFTSSLDEEHDVPYTKGALVENNLVYQNGGGGIQIYRSSNRIVVRSNTCYHNVQSLNYRMTEINVSLSEDLQVYNNIMVSSGTAKLGWAAHQRNSKRVHWNHNCLYRNGSDERSKYVLNGEQTVYADPKFVDPERGDFRVATDSPVIDRGQDRSDLEGGGPQRDLAGNRRIQGATIDLGAFETR